MLGNSSNAAVNSSVSSWATDAASIGSASPLDEGCAKAGVFREGARSYSLGLLFGR